MCETIFHRNCQLAQEDPAPGSPRRRSVERNLTWITSGSVKAELGCGAYLAHPALRVASAGFWPLESVDLRALDSRRANGGHSSHADLVVPAVAAAAAGDGISRR